MVNVWNWQLNRNMKYEYVESRPIKQISAVFDINKCIGCQTCTMACKTTWTSGKGQEYMFWNNVETKPWGSYPRGWDVRILDKLGPQSWDTSSDPKTFEGETIFEKTPFGERVEGWRPDDLDWAYPNTGEDETNEVIDETKYHLTIPHAIWNFYLARTCMQCTFPACLAACPRKAIYKRKDDGIVLIDQERCRGYRECVKACPYKRSMYNHVTRVSEKCIFCFPEIEKGKWPRCMRNCIGKIRIVGHINKPEESVANNPIDFLVHEKKLALPLLPQLGLEPNVYYVPPIHVDAKFNRQMFGPDADSAVETYKSIRNGDEPELRAVLLLCASTDKILGSFELDGDEVIGYNISGTEVARLPLKEPEIVRDFYDPIRDVYRHNIT